MFCPHCHNKIPDGSNICPLCYANLAGVRAPSSKDAPQGEGAQGGAPKQSAPRAKKDAYTKGSRGSHRKTDRTPMLIAFGLIVILVIIIGMIIRSMFIAGAPGQTATPEPAANVTPEGNFMVFGATDTPAPPAEVTPEPEIEVTPTPSPTPEVTYTMLRKGDQSRDVVTLQQALAQLGYLNGAADGNFGTATETAVKKFQSDNGLNADGIAGKLTLEALYSKSTVTPMPVTTADPSDILDLPG